MRILVFLFLFPTIVFAQVYKCPVDGRQVYQDRPCIVGQGKQVQLPPDNRIAPAPMTDDEYYKIQQWKQELKQPVQISEPVVFNRNGGNPADKPQCDNIAQRMRDLDVQLRNAGSNGQWIRDEHKRQASEYNRLNCRYLQ